MPYKFVYRMGIDPVNLNHKQWQVDYAVNSCAFGTLSSNTVSRIQISCYWSVRLLKY